MKFASVAVSCLRFLVFIAVFVFAVVVFAVVVNEAFAKPMPNMSKMMGEKCGMSLFDVYTPPEKGSFPVVVSLSNRVDAVAGTAPKVPKKSKKTSRKKSKRGASAESLQAMERFFVVQGYVVINFRSTILASTSLTAGDVADVLKDLSCAVEKSVVHGANPAQVFLLAEQRLAAVAISESSAESRISVLPGLLGSVLIEPESDALFGKAAAANLPHALVVDVADSVDELKSFSFGKKLVAAGFSVSFVPARKKKKRDLASDLGMASDVVTRDVIDFIRQRIRAQAEQKQPQAPAQAPL